MKLLGTVSVLVFFAFSQTAFSQTAEKTAQTPAEQVAGIQKMCADSSAAIQQRQTQKPLYDRLGKKVQIKKLVENILVKHQKNPQISHLFAKVKKGPFVKNVTDFLVSGTGGKTEYKGKDIATAHKDLNISNADFLTAGGDIQQVMKEMKYGENEIQEVVCSLTAFVPVVVKR